MESLTRVSAVIPAHNEEQTVGNVIDAARAAKLVDKVIVVDNASEDRTSEVALTHGARVIREEKPGKGQAMSAGVRATSAGVRWLPILTGLRAPANSSPATS